MCQGVGGGGGGGSEADGCTQSLERPTKKSPALVVSFALRARMLGKTDSDVSADVDEARGGDRSSDRRNRNCGREET